MSFFRLPPSAGTFPQATSTQPLAAIPLDAGQSRGGVSVRALLPPQPRLPVTVDCRLRLDPLANNYFLDGKLVPRVGPIQDQVLRLLASVGKPVLLDVLAQQIYGSCGPGARYRLISCIEGIREKLGDDVIVGTSAGFMIGSISGTRLNPQDVKGGPGTGSASRPVYEVIREGDIPVQVVPSILDDTGSPLTPVVGLTAGTTGPGAPSADIWTELARRLPPVMK